MDNRKIEVFLTKEENVTISVDNKFLHSRYYPKKEAGKFINNNKKVYENKNNIVVYGIGCGYHIKELLLKSNKESNIYIFDVDEEVIRIVKELGLLEEIEKDKRVNLFLGKSRFNQEFGKKLELVEDILLYNPSIAVIPNEYSDIRDILKAYELSKIGIARFADIAIENKKYNLSLSKVKTIKEFMDEFLLNDKPIVIAAGGPSLEKDLDIMRKRRDDMIIFAVGRSLDILMKNSIKPDMITIIDPQEIVYTQMEKYIYLDVPLCFLSTACKTAVEAYSGPKYIFFNEENVDNIIVNTGKSVAVAALDIAIKAGAKEIIFCGQDLAFTDNRLHAGDKKIYINDINNNYKKVISVNNELLNTTSGMLEFKRNIENLIKDNINIQFINSSNGARIYGTYEMNLMNCIIK